MKDTPIKINIATFLFSLTILTGLWTVQSNSIPALHISGINAQEEYPSTYEEPSSIDEPSNIIDEPSSSDTSSTDNQCTTPSLVCCNPYANHIGRPLGECEECSDSVCDLPSDTESSQASDEPSSSDVPSSTPSDKQRVCNGDECYIPVCCEPGNKNTVPGPGEGEMCDSDVCIPCDQYICCNANATNNVGVENRPSGNDNCAPPYTTCRSDTPTCTFEPCNPLENPTCNGGGCTAAVTCTISNGTVSITGAGAASFPAGTSCTASSAAQEAEAACSSLTPAMPVGTTLVYSSFAAAIVTGIDVCLNLDGDQSAIPLGYSRATDGSCQSSKEDCDQSGGTWVNGTCVDTLPACGFSGGKSNLQTPPTSGLCNPGTASAINTASTAYTWTCADTTTGEYKVSCSATRCTGDACNSSDLCTNIPGDQDNAYITTNNLSRTSDGECYPIGIDLCSNITGTQDIDYLDEHNLYRDEYGRCWDDNGGACGTAMNMLTWATPPQNNLCDPTSSATEVIVDDTNLKYKWSCLDVEGNTVGMCSVNMLCASTEKNCKGRCIPETETCLETATTTLIQMFKIVPKVVQKPTDTCTLSWTISNENPDSEKPLTCNLNGVTITNFNSSKAVSPGVQRMMCAVGDEYQEKAVRCEINPEYKEV